MRILLPLFVLATLLAPRALEAKPQKASEIVEIQEGELLRLHLAGDEAAQGWLHRPPGTESPTPEDPVDLVVVLHGAGGTPKTLFFPALMKQRRAWCLGVAGREAVTHEQGAGFMWDSANASYVIELTEYLLAKHPIRKDRVIVWGHSAGGSMTLETLTKAPTLYAGGLTTAAPRTPDGRHQDLRVCVLLGTKDGNWSVAPSVRTHVEGLAKKKSKGACAFLAVDELGHNVPAESYLGLGFDWLLARGTRGGEGRVPLRAASSTGSWRHVLVRPKGSPGAPDDALGKKGARDLLKKMRKELEAGRAWFPMEAACHSHHVESASAGGAVAEETLRALLEALPELEPGAFSEVLESAHGFHLLLREAASVDRDR